MVLLSEWKGDTMNITYNSENLVPVIVQDYLSKEVLMLAYMNEEAYTKTLELNEMVYYSRSRKKLWRKGETSGNVQYLKQLSYDCDNDTLLAKVEQIGSACHTMNRSCFYRDIISLESVDQNIFENLFALIKDRKTNVQKGYTNYLFEKGLDKILKKIAEEAGEVIIASKNNNTETIYEISDLIYHLFVLMVQNGIELDDIYKELSSRRK